jgi:hypothetical protein
MINQRSAAIVAVFLVVTALSWISWRVGSPLMTEIRTSVFSAKNHGLRALAPRGGPVQRILP